MKNIKIILILVLLSVILSGVFYYTYGKDQNYFEDNKEELIDIITNYVDGTDIVISHTYEYETYYKHVHYIYDEHGKARPCEPSYIGKDYLKQGGTCPLD